MLQRYGFLYAHGPRRKINLPCPIYDSEIVIWAVIGYNGKDSEQMNAGKGSEVIWEIV
jgi:hypothetical protein